MPTTPRDDVLNLLGLYCHHLDGGDPGALADLFAEDAVLTVMGKAVRGRPAIRAWFDEMAGAPALSVHLTSNSVVTVDGERATALSNWSTARLGPSSREWRIFAVGTYADELVLTTDGWRFGSRVDSVLGDFTLEETIERYLAAD